MCVCVCVCVCVPITYRCPDTSINTLHRKYSHWLSMCVLEEDVDAATANTNAAIAKVVAVVDVVANDDCGTICLTRTGIMVVIVDARRR